MTQRTRRILLGLATLIFLIVGFFMIMYARGYRWDFDKNTFLLSGAVYLKPVQPSNAQILINGKDTGKTSATLIKNLLPARKYQARVLSDGYQPWEKEFQITPGLVTNAENIVLFPQELKSQILWPETKDLADFSVSPNQEFIALKTSATKLFMRDLVNLNATATPLTFTDRKKTIGITVLKNNKGWSSNSQKFAFARDIAAKKLWYIWDNPTKNVIDLTSLYERKIVLKQASASPLPTKFSPTKIAWLGNNSFLVLLEGRLFQLDVENETMIDLKLSEITDFDNFENKIVALKNPDILMLMDSAVENVSILGQTQFAPQNILISPDGSKIAYTDNNSLGIFWLKDTNKQPLKKLGDQEVIYKTSASISGTYWHASNEHLIFLENQNLKTAELDTRDKVNTATWPETIAALNYLPQDSKLYILENSAVKSIDGKF